VANIYDAAGQRVYRATHGFFMSPGALFLHVVRCDSPEEKSVAGLLEWVEAMQQEAPGAVMGIVWTHIEHFGGSLCASAGWQEGFLYVAGTTAGFEMHYLHHHGAPCSLKDVGVALFNAESTECFLKEASGMDDAAGDNTNVMSGVGAGGLQGKVALIDLRNKFNRLMISQDIKTALPLLVCAGALGLIVVINDCYFQSIVPSNHFQWILLLDEIKPLFADVASIPIIFIRKMHTEALTPTGAIITAFHGATFVLAFLLYLPACLWLNWEVLSHVGCFLCTECVHSAMRRQPHL